MHCFLLLAHQDYQHAEVINGATRHMIQLVVGRKLGMEVTCFSDSSKLEGKPVCVILP